MTNVIGRRFPPANRGDLLTSYNGTAISYDNVGNPTSYRGNACTWNNGRQLAGFGAWNFTYDADGLRTSRAMGTATVYEYTYVDGVLTKMTVGGNTLRFAYSVDGTPCSVNYNGTEYYYVTNVQGDVTAILDGSGNAVTIYTYDAWGKVLTSAGSLGHTIGLHNPLRYRGYVYDTDTGLYYLQSRYYDPEVGRFINEDNNFRSYNLYLYCCNNPVNRIDATGEHWYYLWLDDLFESVDDLLASASNLVFGREAYKQSIYNPRRANELWNSRPFQDTKPSQEMQIFTEFMYDHDFVADISVSVDVPIENTYIKAGISKVLSPNKNMEASYVHVGVGQSTPSVLPINISYSVGFVSGVKTKEDYAGSFYDVGASSIVGLDYCWWPGGSSAYSFTVSTSYGAYGGYDFYWCLD